MNDFLQSLRNGQADKPRTPKTRKNYDNSYQYSSGPRFQSYGSGFQNPRNQQMKRPSGLPHQGGNQMPAEDPGMTLIADVLDNLTSHVEDMVKNQEYMLSIQERTAEMLERQTMILEQVVGQMNLSQGMVPMEEDPMEPVYENHMTTSPRPGQRLRENSVQEKTKKREPAAAPGQTVRKRRKVVSKNRAASKPATPKKAELMSREAIMDIIDSMRNEGATFDQVAKHLVDLGQPTFSGRGEWHAQTIHRLCSKK